MVTASDLKVYKTTNFLGGAITGTQVPNANPNNIFTNIPKNELVTGKEYYACVYIKNTHATESMDNLTWILTSKSLPLDTNLKWSFDPINFLESPYIFFDGNNDSVNLGDQATLWSQAKTKFSFSFWIFAQSWASGGVNDRDILRHDGTSNGRFSVESITAGGDKNIQFTIKNTSGTVMRASAVSITTTDWHYVVCTYDNSLGSQNMKIYVDTVVEGTANITDTVTLTGDLKLGGTSATVFNGYIKDFKWWNNKALTQSEIDALYDLSNDLTPDYWLPMTEGTGSPKDAISQSLTATLSNAVWSTGTAQTIANMNTAPLRVHWNGIQQPLDHYNISSKFLASQTIPIWLWLHVDANAEARIDDNAIFSYNFDIPIGGTGSTGGGDTGGSGGNPPPTPTNYKVAVAGDWGCENETDDVIKLIQDQGYGHVAGVGDNAYASASCWTSRFTPLKSIMNSAYGNHEYEESGGITPYKTFFSHSKTYFTYKFQNIQFFVIDSNINGDPGSAQYIAIKAALEASLLDNTVVWRVALYHHPSYGAASKHTYNDANTRQNYHQLMITNKVNIVVQGHNHNWQRSHQLAYNSSNSASPIVVGSSSPYSKSAAGIIFVISGAGGHDSGSSLYSLTSTPSYNAYQSRTWNGVWEMIASNSGNTLTCAFRDTNGDVHDSFVINA